MAKNLYIQLPHLCGPDYRGKPPEVLWWGSYKLWFQNSVVYHEKGNAEVNVECEHRYLDLF